MFSFVLEYNSKHIVPSYPYRITLTRHRSIGTTHVGKFWLEKRRATSAERVLEGAGSVSMCAQARSQYAHWLSIAPRRSHHTLDHAECEYNQVGSLTSIRLEAPLVFPLLHSYSDTESKSLIITNDMFNNMWRLWITIKFDEKFTFKNTGKLGQFHVTSRVKTCY